MGDEWGISEPDWNQTHPNGGCFSDDGKDTKGNTEGVSSPVKNCQEKLNWIILSSKNSSLLLWKHPFPLNILHNAATEKSILVAETLSWPFTPCSTFCNGLHSPGTAWSAATIGGDGSAHHSSTARSALLWVGSLTEIISSDAEKEALPVFPNARQSNGIRWNRHFQKWAQTAVTKHCISGGKTKPATQAGTRDAHCWMHQVALL